MSSMMQQAKQHAIEFAYSYSSSDSEAGTVFALLVMGASYSYEGAAEIALDITTCRNTIERDHKIGNALKLARANGQGFTTIQREIAKLYIEHSAGDIFSGARY